jgi:dGTPase
MWTYRRSGQNNQRGSQDHRDPFERDKTRVIHCPSFRRLQGKPQIIPSDGHEFRRTRLTHSLEVASIGQSIARHLGMIYANDAKKLNLLPNRELIEVICLLHDVGHPPFGHGGETALNYMMRHHGGFESNAQTLRILTKIENSYGQDGLDLTRRSLLGILKYPVPMHALVSLTLPESSKLNHRSVQFSQFVPPKAYYDSEQPEVEWLLHPFKIEDKHLFQSLKTPPTETTHGKSAYRTFDTSLLNKADNIAYGVHDFEDALQLKLIQRHHIDTKKCREYLMETPLWKEDKNIFDELFSREVYRRKQAIGEMVNYFITATDIAETNPTFENDFLKYNVVLKPEAKNVLRYFIKVIYKHVIDAPESRTFEYGGQTVLVRLFDAIVTNPMTLLDVKNRKLFEDSTSEEGAFRVVSDYIACMTDEYAYHLHERLFGFNNKHFSDRS